MKENICQLRIRIVILREGSSYHLTVPKTSHLNGISERRVTKITGKALAMVVAADL